MFSTLSVLAVLAAGPADDLKSPVALKAGDKLINVDVGHAAPYLYDLDADGLPDLLVGQFGEGKVRFYKNVGKKGEPKFSDFKYLQVGGKDASVPSG